MNEIQELFEKIDPRTEPETMAENIIAMSERSAKKLRVKFRAAAALAAGAIVLGSLGAILYGERLTAALTDAAIPPQEQSRRYDELVSEGDYYLNGDAASGIYFHVENGTVTLFGEREKIYGFYRADSELTATFGDGTEELENMIGIMTERYFNGTKFALVKAGTVHKYDDSGKELPVDILKYGFVENVDKLTETQPFESYSFAFTDRSLTFNGSDTIRLKPLGDFILK